MKKRTLLSAITMAFLFANIPTITFADPNSSTNDIIQENLNKYEQLDSETLAINAEITKLNNDIEIISTDLEENNNNLNNTEKEIETINKKIDDATSKIEELQDTFSDRLCSMYKSNISSTMLVYIINSEGISDFFNRLDAMKKILSIDKEMITSINEQKSQLKENQKLAEEKKEDLITLKSSIEADLEELNYKKSEQEVALAELNNRKSEVMDIIEKNEVSLISNSLSVINSGSSSSNDIRSALDNLKSILPQLNSSYAISLAEEAITSANSQISALATPSRGYVENTTSTSTSSGSYIATYSMTATAYTGGGVTALGLTPVRNPNGLSSVAVDPNVIPLGSKVYVDGYGYAIASDTGGVINGNKIDLYMNTLEECYSFGRRTVTVHLVAYPNEW